jgi:hypothetical protein
MGMYRAADGTCGCAGRGRRLRSDQVDRPSEKRTFTTATTHKIVKATQTRLKPVLIFHRGLPIKPAGRRARWWLSDWRRSERAIAKILLLTGLGQPFCRSRPLLPHWPQLERSVAGPLGSVVEFLGLYHVRVYHSGVMMNLREKNAKIDGEMVERSLF